jgi:Na+-transporting NADH:ubiquinone oxidoreductase subunit NqrF
MFTAIVLALVFVIIYARTLLVSSGNVNIEINGEKTITVPAGGKLLQTLSEANIFLASACGGGGTCAQCKCIVRRAAAPCCRRKSRISRAATPARAGACPARPPSSRT